ncbi:MAG TPA: glutamate synthase-related protein, partial [Gaiellales bacterium]|nr:glutamate synthase-related protein [Gaiellales bacterium]
FKQLFAQVTNPAIDPQRETLVMSLRTAVGAQGNLLDESPDHARRLAMAQPVLTSGDLAKLRALPRDRFRTVTLECTFDARGGGRALERALDALCRRASRAIALGEEILVLSDRSSGGPESAPIPALLATAAVHSHLVREGWRTKCGLIVESGEPREVMDFALLVGFGAAAVNPYVALDLVAAQWAGGDVSAESAEDAQARYVQAVGKGLLKVLSKMGVSTVMSYRGAQLFECVGLSADVVARYFTGTPSRVGGIGLEAIAEDVRRRHEHALAGGELDPGGLYAYRLRGERHVWNPEVISALQRAVRDERPESYRAFSAAADEENRLGGALRGLMELVPAAEPLPLDEVEPSSEIVRRFASGAMSLGSISKEAHETLAIALNRLGGRSNSGEGGEDARRSQLDANGDSRRSAIKQVASARFGVTTAYLVDADVLQIKVSQGAKPGEGGQLPGHKVDVEIARLRHSTPGVGTVAAGVAKAGADHIVIAGMDGGTGASPTSSIRHAGVPWELGLAETQQVLVGNDLRGRVRLQVDGGLRTGLDVVIGALLGAEEFGFSTAPLVAAGCIMMRVCHLNTCPVGIATQDPELRRRFTGTPEHVLQYLLFVAEEVRELMASMGVRRFDDLVGRTDLARQVGDGGAGIDLGGLLAAAVGPDGALTRFGGIPGTAPAAPLDREVLELAGDALARGEQVTVERAVHNTDRAIGALLSGEIVRRLGPDALADGALTLQLSGTAGQSLGAWGVRGLVLDLEGQANDYVGKGLSGARIVVRPPANAGYEPSSSIAVGNTTLYGATSGELFVRGCAGERFAVRNSGATAVVEGVGRHGCEYMTGGLVAVLGPVGRNFAAGMSGGIAYLWDPDGENARRVNSDMVLLRAVSD